MQGRSIVDVGPLGILGKGYCAVARDYGIALILLHRFLNGEHQEDLNSTDADEGSLDEESSTGDFSCGELLLNFVNVGL